MRQRKPATVIPWCAGPGGRSQLPTGAISTSRLQGSTTPQVRGAANTDTWHAVCLLRTCAKALSRSDSLAMFAGIRRGYRPTNN
jgi:hypothetical protein